MHTTIIITCLFCKLYGLKFPFMMKVLSRDAVDIQIFVKFVASGVKVNKINTAWCTRYFFQAYVSSPVIVL